MRFMGFQVFGFVWRLWLAVRSVRGNGRVIRPVVRIAEKPLPAPIYFRAGRLNGYAGKSWHFRLRALGFADGSAVQVGHDECFHFVSVFGCGAVAPPAAIRPEPNGGRGSN